MSFRYKAVLGIALIEAVFLFAILMSSLSFLGRSNERALRLRGESDARLFGAVAASALMREEVGSLRAIVRQVVRSQGVLYAAALNNGGRLLAAAGERPARVGATARSVYKVRVGGVVYGEVEVVLSHHGLTALLHHAGRRILFIALSEMAFVAVFSWLLGTYLVQQIAAVEAGAGRLARGELGFLLPVRGRDELARMTLGFNAMSAQLKASQEAAARRDHDLLELNERLQAQVHERTTVLAGVTRELEYRATHDPLTGLPNRILLQDRLLQAIAAARGARAPFVLMVLDLDSFKDVNDTMGHHVGDQLLQEVARRLQARLRQSDTAVRLGGDEFALLLPTIASLAHAEAVASKLLEGIEEPMSLEGRSLRMTASIGAVFFPQQGEDASDLLRHAERAMHEAKRQRTGFLSFEPSMEGDGDDRVRLQMDLERAINQGELLLHYQPKIDLRTGMTAGAEALVRWQHPTFGLLPPARFVPLAERTRLIRPLSLAVLKMATRQARKWLDEGQPLPIAMNVSTANLDDENFVGQVKQIVRTLSLPPGLIEFEVTETALMDKPERAQLSIQQLADAGVRVSIDDFGTGYSSMAYLRKLAVAKIKIDKSFVTDMHVNRNDTVIVRSIIDLGHSLGLKVVGEGVENAESLAMLADLGCDFAQGYHMARPLAVEAFEVWRANHP